MFEDPHDDHILLTPGPTPIHPRAQRALMRGMLGHMDPEVFALNREIQADLREMYGTGPEAFTALLAGTGSLGMEAGFANLVEAGDEVLVCANGSFGHRMAEMAARYGARVRLVTAPLGEATRRTWPRSWAGWGWSRWCTARRARASSTLSPRSPAWCATAARCSRWTR
jgi:alanine-glyoxylate transaminase/serine-glyoxylate transaminase/serine-pyruvate transaminase